MVLNKIEHLKLLFHKKDRKILLYQSLDLYVLTKTIKKILNKIVKKHIKILNLLLNL